uniref:Uncharacterized protein n=1 Tax=Salix viminalis TaxID=40686 RepID=A0A6N2L026_SALVM
MRRLPYSSRRIAVSRRSSLTMGGPQSQSIDFFFPGTRRSDISMRTSGLMLESKGYHAHCIFSMNSTRGGVTTDLPPINDKKPHLASGVRPLRVRRTRLLFLGSHPLRVAHAGYSNGEKCRSGMSLDAPPCHSPYGGERCIQRWPKKAPTHLPILPGRGGRDGPPCGGGIENDGLWWTVGVMEEAAITNKLWLWCCRRPVGGHNEVAWVEIGGAAGVGTETRDGRQSWLTLKMERVVVVSSSSSHANFLVFVYVVSVLYLCVAPPVNTMTKLDMREVFMNEILRVAGVVVGGRHGCRYGHNMAPVLDSCLKRKKEEGKLVAAAPPSKLNDLSGLQIELSSEGFLVYESKTRDFWINLRLEKSGIDWGKNRESGTGAGRRKGDLFARVLAKRRRRDSTRDKNVAVLSRILQRDGRPARSGRNGTGSITLGGGGGGGGGDL